MRQGNYTAAAVSALLAAVAGVGLAIFAFTRLYSVETRLVQKQFALDVEQAAVSLDREISLNLEVLHALALLFENGKELDPGEFGAYARRLLERHPSIQALEWIPEVAHVDRESYETARREKFPGFRFTEREQPGRMVTAAPRDTYFPVYYVEPYEGNEAALGFDLASNPTRKQALETAAKTGHVTATASITLVQEASDQRGVLCFLRIRDRWTPGGTDSHASNKGFVLAVYRIGELLEQSMAIDRSADMNLRLVDVSEPGAAEILHVFGDDGMFSDADSAAWHSHEVADIGGRTWRLDAMPSEAYVAARRGRTPILVLVLGSALALVLASYLFAVARHAAVVENTVVARTRELRTALDEIRTLGGLLPICSICKRIRDDRGYWNQIESYLREHSDADFTHSVCPECVESEYADLADEGVAASADSE